MVDQFPRPDFDDAIVHGIVSSQPYVKGLDEILSVTLRDDSKDEQRACDYDAWLAFHKYLFPFDCIPAFPVDDVLLLLANGQCPKQG